MATAWKTVVRRHTMIRTIFVQQPSRTLGFYQAVLDNIEHWIEHIKESSYVQDLLAFPEAQWHQYATQHELTIVEGTGSQITILLVCSYALIDYASLQILLRDIAHTYSGREAQPATIHYSDFTASIQQTRRKENPPSGATCLYQTL